MTFDRAWRPESARKVAIARRWPALTPEDLEIAGRDRGMLAVRVVERYGLRWERARREIEEWEMRAL